MAVDTKWMLLSQREWVEPVVSQSGHSAMGRLGENSAYAKPLSGVLWCGIIVARRSSFYLVTDTVILRKVASCAAQILE
jgi:hypothetical protein